MDMTRLLSRSPGRETDKRNARDEWGKTHGSGIWLTGRTVLNMWRLMRSELKLCSYTLQVCNRPEVGVYHGKQRMKEEEGRGFFSLFVYAEIVQIVECYPPCNYLEVMEERLVWARGHDVVASSSCEQKSFEDEGQSVVVSRIFFAFLSAGTSSPRGVQNTSSTSQPTPVEVLRVII